MNYSWNLNLYGCLSASDFFSDSTNLSKINSAINVGRKNYYNELID